MPTVQHDEGDAEASDQATLHAHDEPAAPQEDAGSALAYDADTNTHREPRAELQGHQATETVGDLLEDGLKAKAAMEEAAAASKAARDELLAQAVAAAQASKFELDNAATAVAAAKKFEAALAAREAAAATRAEVDVQRHLTISRERTPPRYAEAYNESEEIAKLKEEAAKARAEAEAAREAYEERTRQRAIAAERAALEVLEARAKEAEAQPRCGKTLN